MTMKPETYVCIQGSPEIPRGSIAVPRSVTDYEPEYPPKLYDLHYTIYYPGTDFTVEEILWRARKIKWLTLGQVEQNPECWRNYIYYHTTY